MRGWATLCALVIPAAVIDALAQEYEPEPGLTATYILTLEQSGDHDGRGPPQTLPLRGSERVHVTYHRKRDYRLWTLELDAVADDMPYGRRGTALSAFTLKREDGASAIPYRAIAGEFYAATTSFTVSRMLKGASLELQPFDARHGILHSVVAFAGKNADEWKDFGSSTDNSVGFSWVAQPIAAEGAHAGVHAVRNSVVSDDPFNPGRRSQAAASLSGSVPFPIGRTQWRVEGELARVRGDSGPGSAEEFQGRAGNAVYALLGGTAPLLGLTWSTQVERNTPESASYASWSQGDRRRSESRISWSRGSASAEVRHDATREEATTERPRDDRGAGVMLNIPLPGTLLQWRTDAWRRSVQRAGTESRVGERAESAIERNQGLFRFKAGVAVQDEEDLANHDNDRRQRDLFLRVSYDTLVDRRLVSVTPRVTLQRTSAPLFTQRKVIVGGDFMVQGDVHGLGVHLNGNTARTGQALMPDVVNVASTIEYTYHRGPHLFSLGYQALDVRTRPGVTARRYTAGMQWTMTLGPQTRGTRVAARPSLAAAAYTYVGPIPKNAGALVEVPIGADRARLAAELAVFGSGTQSSNAAVYDVQFLLNVPGRQRFAVVYDPDDRVEKVALLLSLDNTGPADASRAYDRVLREMIERFGPPDVARQEGMIRETYASDFASGRAVRYAEWRRRDGVLRLGIPRRLDGVVRIEVQHALALRDPRSSGWGLASVD
ncbi:MAG TPA: hypothetical protein VM122_00870 [Usitatibacter sp.]|nr:hypothetical protein [Usitatibacter sp.]